MSDNNERTFTQAELDQIISERLKREREKVAAEQAQREAELTRRERLLTAKEDWAKRGLPADLLDSLDLSKDGVLDAAAAIVEKLKAPTTEPKEPAPAVPYFTRSLNGSGGVGVKPDPLRDAFGLNHRKDE